MNCAASLLRGLRYSLVYALPRNGGGSGGFCPGCFVEDSGRFGVLSWGEPFYDLGAENCRANGPHRIAPPPVAGCFLQDLIGDNDGNDYTPAFLAASTPSPEKYATQQSILELLQVMMSESLTKRQHQGYTGGDVWGYAA